MKMLDTLAELEAIFDAPVPTSLKKVVERLTPAYQSWIGQSRFCILSTVGPEGTDASPRGDIDPVARIVDDRTLAIPDWRGNNRIDSLRNIMRDPRVSLMFMVPGSNNVVRVNGTARLTADPVVTGSYEQSGKHPKVVIVVTLAEAYFQCAKAAMRSGLWGDQAAPEGLPRAGDFLKEADADFDAATYEATYAQRAKDIMW